MILPQSWPLQSKIWTTAAAPSINYAPLGTMAETAVPETKDTKATTSEATRAARRSQSGQRTEAGVCTIRSGAIAPSPAKLSRSSEGDAPDLPVHQPPDREDDKDQPEYTAAIPTGPPLCRICHQTSPWPAWGSVLHEQGCARPRRTNGTRRD